MRKLNGIKWLFSILVLFSSVTTADVLLNGLSVIETADINSVQINHLNGNVLINTKTDYTVTEVTGDPGLPDPVRISSFSGSPSTINENGSTQISWNTQNAESCTPTGGAGGWSDTVINLPTGSTTIEIASSGSYEFKLSCDGPSGPAIRTTTIIVNAPTSDPDPAKVCGDSPLSGATNKTWKGFWGVDFPGPIYNNINTSITRSGYLAIEFETGDIVDNGLLVTVGNTTTAGTRKGSISECPGIFKVAQECTFIWGIGGGIKWATNGKDGACQLKPKTTYYFNVTFTDGFGSDTTTCTTDRCVATLQHVNR